MRLSVGTFALAFGLVFFSAAVAPAEKPASSALGASCVSSDPGRLCMALKYVVYRDPAGVPVSGLKAALGNISVMNRLWSQCGISFQLEVFTEVDPSRFGLSFHPSNLSEMDSIRAAFADPGHLLLVTTGTWNRGGTLGESPANAWTAMPTAEPYGSVFEASVATYSAIYSHEMGHYLNLDHASHAGDLMNPIIYRRSTHLGAEECETARATAESFWSQAIRS